jgi:SLA1 Homology Domain 1 (SHD1) protein
MRRSIRTAFVCLIVAAITLQPAMACDFCHGWGGDYYYAPVYDGPVVYDGGCCGCGYETVIYDDCCSSCCDGVVSEGLQDETIQPPATASPAITTPPPATQPMTTPAIPPQPPATTETPAVQPALPPAATQPGTTEAPKTAEPGGLFGTEPSTTTPPPATPPQTTPPVATPPAAQPTTPAKPDEGLFGTPAEKPATPPAATPPAGTQPPAKSPADELFGGTSTTTQKPETPPAPEAKPAEKPATPPPASDEKGKAEEKKSDEGLFGGAPSVLHEAGGLASGEMRLWTDNTGSFSCHGRLVQFVNGHVRVLKDNGRMTTVPLARLSARDLEFVNRQASAQQKAELGKTARAMVAIPMVSN